MIVPIAMIGMKVTIGNMAGIVITAMIKIMVTRCNKHGLPFATLLTRKFP